MGRKWTHPVQWYAHVAALRREQEEATRSYNPESTLEMQSIEERSDSLFVATVVNDSQATSREVTTGSTLHPGHLQPLSAQPLNATEILHEIKSLRTSLSSSASEFPVDKREVRLTSSFASTLL